MTDDRSLWVVQANSATRADGVEVTCEPGKVHRGRRWFFVRRPWANQELRDKALRYGRVFHYLTTNRGNERRFDSVDSAMAATRKQWPVIDAAAVERWQRMFLGLKELEKT